MRSLLKPLAVLFLTLLMTPFVSETALAQDPTVVDSAHYTVDFENDQVRAVRIKYGVGDESVMHFHPESVVVALTDGSVRFTLTDGTTQEATMTAGQVLFTPAGSHQPKNIGDAPLEVIQIELKSGEMMPEE